MIDVYDVLIKSIKIKIGHHCFLFVYLSYIKRNVYEIWCEGRCSGKVNTHLLKILLKIISTEIISI